MEQKRRVRDVAHLWCDKRVMRLFRRLTQIKAKNEHKHLKLVYVALCEIDSDFSEFRNHPTYGIKSLTKTCATYAGMEEGAVNAYMKILRRAGLIDYGMRSNEKGQFCGSWLELYEYDEQWEKDLPIFVERMIKNRQEGKQEEQDATVYGVNPIGSEPNRVQPGLIRNTTCNKPYKNDKSENNTLSVISKRTKYPSMEETKQDPPIDKNEPFLPLAEKLSSIVQSYRKINITPSQIRSWTDEIRKLCSQSKVNPSRVSRALDWYVVHIGESYVPVIMSGSSLREKFINLESAIERSTQNFTPRKQQKAGREHGIASLTFTEEERSQYEAITEKAYNPPPGTGGSDWRLRR